MRMLIKITYFAGS